MSKNRLDDDLVEDPFTSPVKSSTMSSDLDYKNMAGSKLRLMHPSDAVQDFNYLKATGAIETILAPFGRFQTGITI